ncbi:uncharacterized protein ACOB8E_000595 isoform 1-T1 [Sarcophilus harrisii]
MKVSLPQAGASCGTAFLGTEFLSLSELISPLAPEPTFFWRDCRVSSAVCADLPPGPGTNLFWRDCRFSSAAFLDLSILLTMEIQVDFQRASTAVDHNIGRICKAAFADTGVADWK